MEITKSIYNILSKIRYISNKIAEVLSFSLW